MPASALAACTCHGTPWRIQRDPAHAADTDRQQQHARNGGPGQPVAAPGTAQREQHGGDRNAEGQGRTEHQRLPGRDHPAHADGHDGQRDHAGEDPAPPLAVAQHTQVHQQHQLQHGGAEQAGQRDQANLEIGVADRQADQVGADEQCRQERRQGSGQGDAMVRLREGGECAGEHQRHGAEVGAPNEADRHSLHGHTIPGQYGDGNGWAAAPGAQTTSAAGSSAIWPEARSCQATRLE